MASRGRGRGKSAAPMPPEQLGLGKDEQLLVILDPPPKYPSLEYKAPEFTCSTELSYLIELKRSYTEMIQESPNNVQLKSLTNDIERYSDYYQKMIHPEIKYDQRYDWTLLPNELMPTIKRKKSNAKNIVKKQKIVDVEKKLEELEQKETMQGSDTEEVTKPEDDEEKDQDENVEDEEAEVDEEMDDGTDYFNNYFDNGEGYDEEDDNLDDGATY